MTHHKHYDIIADIHGYADKLCQLLAKLGYSEQNGVYRHPTRQAIFLGDFIDRGPAIPQTVTLVRRMVESGTALAVMGNHEYNAIALNIPRPGGDFARPHTINNIVAHAETLRQYRDTYRQDAQTMWQNDLDWFLTLPVYLDLPEIRIAHACWDTLNVQKLKTYLNEARLTRDQILNCELHKHDASSLAVSETLKGKEFDLAQIDPALAFIDPDGRQRTVTRLRWWHKTDLPQVALGDMLFDVAAHAVNRQFDRDYFDSLSPDDDARPLFFGHYWLKGQPALIGDKIACLDFSVAKGGVLTAYQFDGETILTNEKLVYV